MFTGSGRTEKSLFSYFASWAGGGRWGVEVTTNGGRYKLTPLEELSFCKKNQFQWENIPLNDENDKDYKPGIFKLVHNAVIRGDVSRLSDLDYQIKFCQIVDQMCGYEN